MIATGNVHFWVIPMQQDNDPHIQLSSLNLENIVYFLNCHYYTKPYQKASDWVITIPPCTSWNTRPTGLVESNRWHNPLSSSFTAVWLDIDWKGHRPLSDRGAAVNGLATREAKYCKYLMRRDKKTDVSRPRFPWHTTPSFL